MFSVYNFVIAVLLLSATNCSLGQIEPRIFDGLAAELGYFPYQVLLQNVKEKSYFCGGSLIDAKHVVTAANCLSSNDLSNIKVWAGGVNSIHRGTYKSVKHIFKHDKYNFENRDNDIAVLRLDSPFTFNNNTKPIALPTSDFQPEVYCNVSGWGYNKDQNNRLMYTFVRTFNNTICQKSYNDSKISTNNKICASDSRGNKACWGDEGSPLSCQAVSDKNTSVLAGVVSYTNGCGNLELPTAFTNVYKYVKWIKTQQTRNSAIPLNCNLFLFFVIVSTNILYTFMK